MNEKIDKWKDYLKEHYQPATQKRYLWEIERFRKALAEPEDANRDQILDYIDQYRKKGKSADYLRAILAVLKAWYRYLLETGKRKDHPCRYLQLKDQRSTQLQLQDLFSEKELELLRDREERYPILTSRNQIITGLLIYQGVSLQELCKLRPKDIELEKARVAVPATTRTNSRILELTPRQILPLHRYLEKDREILLNGKEAKELLITKKGSAEKGEGIHYLISTKQKLFPQRKLSPSTIRMSVITNWLKSGINLRQVQYMAGHKKPSSTERYKQSDLDNLKSWIEKYHPLG